ncbi:EcsC family protein [Hespellia stercorisuis]|uniref:EcsC protein family protein n=1 Tax=Hespellia stercorisuis DSM 15480 TaxID=1121950 RepID=A0A1M6PH66_9FIRM|nr:EcsC family protein [Hespellia stercorisuis]SHK07273.1 EcsC protein family protein [Hespellia stercorisuis DSM 15480]
MQIFHREKPLRKEWRRLEEEEKRFLRSHSEKRENILNQKLDGNVPSGLQSMLDTAFEKAFGLIFEKGTGVIEKTYHKEKLEQDYRVREYTADIKQDAKSLRSFSKKSKGEGTKNLLVSGVSGVGMGVLGIGIPDIPVFTGMILKSIYQTALHYGCRYDTEEERYFILLLIQGALSYGEQSEEIEEKINTFICTESCPADYDEKEQIDRTAGTLSRELLYMKFLQGIPVVGIVGGMYDAVYMKEIIRYADLKYRRRFLNGR